MMHRTLPLAATLGILSLTPPLHAQTQQDVIAFTGMMQTPAGALAPVMTNTMLNRLQNGASLALRYGHVSSGDLAPTTNSFGVTGVLPVGLGSTLSVTGGLSAYDCSGCNTALMLGAGGDMRLYGAPFGTTATSPLVTVSLDGQLGYSHVSSTSFFSGYVGAPIALVARGNGMQFAPFITPGFGFAQESVSGSSDSGTIMMLGGGVGVYNMASNVTVNVGLQHAFITNGNTMLGLTLTLGGR